MQYDSTTFNLCHSPRSLSVQRRTQTRRSASPSPSILTWWRFSSRMAFHRSSLSLVRCPFRPNPRSSLPPNELDEYLVENFSRLLMYLDGARHIEFYNDFCKDYLWPLVH